ncbi:MAG: PASTA domain-containing protein [Synergistaceae bacterium]|nr:PASTA domain-containing protein [Synergistaceae bacterium]
MRRKGGIIAWVLFMVVVTIFASGAIAVYTIFLKPENNSQVPQLVGKSESEAVAEAESAGLVVQLEPVASTMPEGRVLAQSPQAGTELRQGRVIVLQVSQSGELHAIPDVTGKTLAKAQEEIKAQGFSLGDVIKISEPNAKAGTVIAQSPAAPASVNSGRKIDLLVQAGNAQPENITIPDVNRMTEDEARNILETGGVKVQAVERVYSPLLPEGLAIETKPGAGTSVRPGQGVTLKLATQRRPSGFSDADSKTTAQRNGTVTIPRNTASKNTAQDDKNKTAANTAQNNNRSVTVSVGGEDEVFIGDDYDLNDLTKTAQNNSKPEGATQTSAPSKTPAPAPAPSAASNNNVTAQQNTPASSPASSVGNKTARIRYPVPPLARPMDLRIEITDPNGKREVMSRQVKGGENINTTASYTQECVVSIYLGGEFVWQERQR